MQDLSIFTSPEFGEVRVAIIDGNPWFVGKDVASILGYSNSRKAISDHVDMDDKGVTKRDTLGGSQEMTIINESGLYSLVLSSKLPSAKRFKHWVTTDILPSIRKHGAYLTPEALEASILNPDFLIKLCTQLKAEQEINAELRCENVHLAVENQIMEPKADYFDTLVDRHTLTSFRETAQQLGVRQNDFIDFLLDRKYVYRDKKGKLMPYAERNHGLFAVKETYNPKTEWSGTQTLLTPKGRETFYMSTATNGIGGTNATAQTFNVTIPLALDGVTLTRIVSQIQWSQNVVTVRNLGVG